MSRSELPRGDRRSHRRAIAVARALLGLGGGALAGCGGGGTDGSPADAATANDAPVDASVDGADASADGGDHVCASLTAVDVPCPPGFACVVREPTGVIACETVDAAAAVDAADAGPYACGDIFCGLDCVCVDTASSACLCIQGPGGPLAPPDLPSLT